MLNELGGLAGDGFWASCDRTQEFDQSCVGVFFLLADPYAYESVSQDEARSSKTPLECKQISKVTLCRK
jgi:hypothetical protein